MICYALRLAVGLPIDRGGAILNRMKAIRLALLLQAIFAACAFVETELQAADQPEPLPVKQKTAETAIFSRSDPALLARPPEGDGPLYILPVNGQIEGALVYVFRRGLKEAETTGARAIILDMDTPGGQLDAIWKIMELLQRSPVPTYTYVNPNAISGGALIALATDHIIMAPGAMIGDAKPILGSPLPLGTPQEVPDGLREKVL